MDVETWLLESDDPSVRFWALQDVKGKPQNDPVVLEAQEMIMSSPPVKAIFDNQEPGGWWVKEGDMYLPKYTATTHSLLILAELGTKRTPAIERAIEHIYRFQRDSGHFLIELPATKKGQASIIKDGCCIDGNVLRYLVHFGYLDDPRTRRLIDFTNGYHDDENAGWRCRSYPINEATVFPKNCYMGATKMLRSLSTIPRRNGARTCRQSSTVRRGTSSRTWYTDIYGTPTAPARTRQGGRNSDSPSSTSPTSSRCSTP